jgi:Ca2+-binding RTX toxin-like protein
MALSCWGSSVRIVSAKEIYFIDSAVSDIGALIAAVPRSAEAHVLQAAGDGLDQVLSLLAGRSGYDAVHILSHGRPGALVLGERVIDGDELDARAADLIRLGRALNAGGDLLLYGCEVGKGDAGRAFVGRIAELTGADVAASETLTGAAALGGDWRLQVRHGAVAARTLEVGGYPAVLTAPTINGPSPLGYTEDAAPQLIQGVTLSNGLGYAGGSLRIEVGGATAQDQLALTSDANATDLGAISVDGTTVYLGNGSGRAAIGTVDPTENGQGGQALVIHFTAEDTGAVQNPSFESGVTGWTVGESRVMLGTTVINGHKAPADPTSPPNAGDDAGGIQDMSYDSELSADEHTEGGASLRLFNSGDTADGFDVVHGPYAYSNTFAASAGDTFHFDWQAKAGDDAFDAFGYLMNADTGESIIVINQTGANDTGVQNWTTGSVTVPEDGDYFFVFVSGTYDFTGGKAVGGSLYIDNFRVEASQVTDDVIEAIAGRVTYQNTADDPPADPRDITVTVTDGVGDHASATGEVTVTNVNDELTGGVQVTGDAEQGALLTASNDIVDPDGNGAVSYHWQRETSPGVWETIDGADQTTYQLTQDDVGHAVRAVGSYTDGGGEAESFTSGATTAVADAQLPHTGGLQVTGAAQQGGTLTAVSDIVDPDGAGPINYQWQRETSPGVWEDIDGADEATYALTQDDVGHAVRVVGDYTDGDDYAESATSSASVAVANVNDAPTGGVTVTGTAAQGEILTAANTLADDDGMGTVAYHWQRETGPGVWADIDGADQSTYALTQDDVGHAVRAVASYTDDAGAAEAVNSTATTAVGNVNDAPTGGIAVSGSTAQGETLTVSNDIVDPDGAGTITYQWQRETSPGVWEDIDGADQSTYDLAQDDVGHAVRAVASYTDGGGESETVVGDASAAVANGQFPHTGGIQVAGTATQGEVLTATNDLVDPDGVGAVGYQWQRETSPGVWADIDGADAATYQLKQDDVGHAVRAVASYTDGDGQLEAATSSETAAVADVNDDPVGAVTITGKSQIGSTLTASNSVTDADGLGTITYQWQADGADIDGATDPTLKLTAALHGKQITVVASYTDGAGTPESLVSAATAAVSNAPPTAPPLPPASSDTVDGMQVETSSIHNADGSISQVVTVPVVPADREEIVGEQVLADIPLVTGGSGEIQLLAQIPLGLGLQSIGSPTIKGVGQAGADLIREIRLHTQAGSVDQNHLTGGGSGFLSGLPGDSQLLVRTLVLTGAAAAGAPPEPSPPGASAAAGAPKQSLVVTGAGLNDGGLPTALVIDGGAAAGTKVELHQLQFAAAIGALSITGDAGGQKVWGDGAAQTIRLGEGDDLLAGGGGDDSLQGNAGADQVRGDEGADLLYGGQGDDVVFGGDDNDRVFGDAGHDVVQGNAGADTVNGGDGRDTVYGGQGDDRVFGDGDADRMFGDAGNDWVQGNAGHDTLNGGAGGDTMFGGQGDDLLFGDSEDDRVLGDAGDDWVQGNKGADTLEGGDGSDTVFGGQGNDMVLGQASNDLLFGDEGDDFVQGNVGRDTLLGGVGADLLHGGQGDDVLYGEDGADTLSGDDGDDVLFGGAGADVFMGARGGGVDRILDFSAAEGDRVYIEPGSPYSLRQEGADTIIDLGQGDRMVLVDRQLSQLSDGWIVGG